MGIDEYNDELFRAVEGLATSGELRVGSPALRIARIAVNEGYAGLSMLQQGIYDAVVVPALKRQADALDVVQAMNHRASND